MGADWAGAHVWFSDERCVPPDDERSNYRLVKETLLDPLGDTGPEVHRIKGELGPDAGADDYEEERRGAPRIDLMLLGLGPDAHVASLFPGHATLGVTDRAGVGEPEA